MANFEDGYRYETQVEDDDFEVPDLIEYFIWGVHNPENVESSLIGYHELDKEDLAVPPVKTHDFNEVAMIITLVENEKTKELHKTRFHGGNWFFLNQKEFIAENEQKADKIAILVTNLPVQIAQKQEVLKIIQRAKPDIHDAGLVVTEFKRQFEHFNGNKRFNGRVIVQFGGQLDPTEENAKKSNVTYKIKQKIRAAKKSFTPEFSVKKGDVIRESLVFFISTEFDLIREEMETKFERVDANGHVKGQKMKSGPRFSKICSRCKNAGLEEQRHSLAVCPTVCIACKTRCKNNAHCRKILRKSYNDGQIEKWRKIKADERAVKSLGNFYLNF